MAPELRLRQKYNAFAVDMYALGVILFLVVQQLYPFEEKEDKELKGLETLNPTSDIRWNPNVPLSDECIALLCSLLESNDAKRMTMREMIVHEWMADEIAIIAHLMPPLEELPKKTAIRRSSSSPDEDIRSPSQPQQKKSATKSADHRRHNKSAQRTKSKRKVKSADDKRHKPTSGKGAKGRRKSKRNKKKKKSAVNRTGSGGKHRPKSSKSRIKQPRGHSHENRGSGKGSKTKKKSNQSKNGTGGSKG